MTSSADARRLRALIAILGGSGVLHFLIPKPYQRIVPPQLGDPRTLVLASGAAELACAGLLMARPTRRLGGWLSAGLLVAVFPANLYAIDVVGTTTVRRAGAIARLPLQLPMIAMALRIARES